jgi:hypothetical protein
VKVPVIDVVSFAMDAVIDRLALYVDASDCVWLSVDDDNG